MILIDKVLSDAFLLKPEIYKDNRGYFFESFNMSVFEKIVGEKVNFIQSNQSSSSKGTLRGLHFQKGNHAQSKLVRVIKGSVFDVAVDLRPTSPTFKKWHGVELSDKNQMQFFIPQGFAHGFLALEDETIFQYKVDNYYSFADEGGLFYKDPELSIEWPNIEVFMSNKDSGLPHLNQININELWTS